MLALWNDGDLAIGDVAAAAELLSEVHPDEVVRKLFEDRAREADRLATERQQDTALYELVAALDGAGLSAEAARRLARLLRDFRLAGVHLDAEARAEVAALDERITKLSQDFSRNIRDDVRHVRLAPERLGGLPADWIAAHPVDDDGLVTVTTDYPDLVPFRTYAVDTAARRELTVASQNRAWPVNDGVLAELLELRAQKAALLGFDSWAELDAQTKMTGSAQAIEEFIARLHETIAPQAQADYGVLLEALQAEDPEQASVDFSANMHALELVRRERFDVDTQLARRYLDIAKVRQGLLDVTARPVPPSCRPSTTCSRRCPTTTSTRPSGTSPATRARTTRTCGARSSPRISSRPSTVMHCSTPRSRTATVTSCWPRAGRGTPRSSSRASSAAR